jgi:RNA polymerase sigma factor (TIGR02999 family)
MGEILPLVYDELREIARRYMAKERDAHTLQTTALVNEAYLRLCDARNLGGAGRNEFFAAAANVMRRVLIDHARGKGRDKRGGDLQRVSLSGVDVAATGDSFDLIALDDALGRFAKLDPRAAKVVELRFFGGMTVDEAAEVLGVSKRTVNDDWAFARAWLRRELEGGTPD